MSPIHPAPSQLADLAAAMRPDWDRTQFEGAVAAARTGGWSWPRLFMEVARLLVQEDSSPRDLTEAARDQSQRRVPASPEMTREWASACREFLSLRGGAA